MRNKPIKTSLKEEVLKCKAKCAYCGRSFNEKSRRASLDHVIPRYSKGGTELGNLLVVCTHCNSVLKKHTSLEEFIQDYSKVRYFLERYLNKVKSVVVNGVSYYEKISWIRELL